MLASLLVTLLCSVADSSVQTTAVLANVNIVADEVTTDMLGNIYVISDATITKYNENGKELYHYTDNIAGSPAVTDVSDPMRILLFYPDQNTITFLDRTLSKLEQSVALDRITSLSPVTVCNSTRGSFWLIDRQDFRLKCYDRNFGLLVQSQTLTGIVSISDTCRMQETENHLLLLIRGKGIYVFDRFGNQLTFFPIKEVLSAKLNAGKIEVSSDQGFSVIEILNGKQSEKWQPFQNKYILHLLQNKYIGWNKNGFVIFEQTP